MYCTLMPVCLRELVELHVEPIGLAVLQAIGGIDGYDVLRPRGRCGKRRQCEGQEKRSAFHRITSLVEKAADAAAGGSGGVVHYGSYWPFAFAGNPGATARAVPDENCPMSDCRLLTIYTCQPSNRNMLKSPIHATARGASRHPRHARAPGRDAVRRCHRAAPDQLAVHAGAAGTRADDPRRRAPGRRQAQRGHHRRHARRVARPGARGVPRARGVGPRPAREEPRRVRAPGQRRGSRRDLRTARGARRIRRPPRRAEGRTADVRDLRALVERMDRAAARDELDAYYRANLEVPRPAGRTRRQRQAARDLSAAGQRAAPVSPGDARAGGRAAGLDARASRHRGQDRRRAARPPPAARCTIT